MKKLVLGIFLIGLILVSCDEIFKIKEHIVENKSSFTVSFNCRFSSGHILAPGESKTIKDPDFTSIDNYNPNTRVVLKNDNYYHYFIDLTSYIVRVNNTIGKKASLFANGWLENDMIDILPGDNNDINHTGKIYTNKPTFTVVAETGYPAVADYSMVSGEMMVTIKW